MLMAIRLSRYAAEKVIDLLVSRIVLFTDYFIFKKHVSLSETSLFTFCVAWALWLAIVMPPSTADHMVVGRLTWIFIFSALAVTHFVTFIVGNASSRAFVAGLYAAVWLFLAIITIHARLYAPAAPTLFVLSMMSVFIAVRLFREHQSPTDDLRTTGRHRVQDGRPYG